MSDSRALADIRTFPQLVTYLRDELDWPIESSDFEELTFEYTAEELGIDSRNAAKIEDIKRLRPLVADQPWGIFFVKFAPGRLPVVALRRILNAVVLKKRATANPAERAVWETEDLLFVSNYGEGEQRQITFAHFSQEADGASLPTLHVLGWDNLDTALHIDHVAETLRNKLTWPDDPENRDMWRERWRSAFTLRHKEVITTSRALAVRLAELARTLRARIVTVLSVESPHGPITRLMKAFQQTLVHDLDADAFADMYAQTIAYGLLSARIAGRTAHSDQPTPTVVTSPFLQELMHTFLHLGEASSSSEHEGAFDELGVTEVVRLLDAANMEAVVRDFGDRNPDEDPVIHFYELFLKEYDSKKRMRRGVFYTPRPVVSYIVRSVHHLLQDDFGLTDGLADQARWADVAMRHRGLRIPEGVDPNQPFVTILDPATGTGTFLVEIIDVMHATVVQRWRREGRSEPEIVRLWNDYVSRDLLPRLHGYELLMAAYAIAHLKVVLKLRETGYRFRGDERVNIYLTNTLEPAQDYSSRFSFALPALAHEAQAVNHNKQHRRFTVVVGNPPYAVEGVNQNSWIDGLMDVYRAEVRDEHNIQLLSDDYAKFLRFADSTIEAAGCGVIGMITKSTYINTTAFRGLRRHLLTQFDKVAILDLHGKLYGKTPTGSADTNIFDIRVGVAILFARLIGGRPANDFAYHEMLGLGEDKLRALSGTTYTGTPWTRIPVDTRHWTLEPSARGTLDVQAAGEYQKFSPVLDLAVGPSTAEQQGFAWGGGVKTNRDFFLVAFTRDELVHRLETLASRDLSPVEINDRLGLEDGRYWNTEREREKLVKIDWRERIFPYLYGPFDTRFVAHIPPLIEIGRGGASKRLMQHYQEVDDNVGLVLKRRNLDNEYHHAFVTRHTPDINCLGGQTYTIPHQLYSGHESLFGGEADRFNFTRGASMWSNDGLHDLASADVFNVVYALLHSPTFRTRYGRELKKDFPRIPQPATQALLVDLAQLGGQLVALHLLESAKLNALPQTYVGPEHPAVGRVAWSDETVWLNKAGASDSAGFAGVPAEVWTFMMGGYQVCHKWLKDRKGRSLSRADIAKYQKIVAAIHETVRLMREIDAAIQVHGGWPRAFLTDFQSTH